MKARAPAGQAKPPALAKTPSGYQIFGGHKPKAPKVLLKP
jgi:hypothetical protein